MNDFSEGHDDIAFGSFQFACENVRLEHGEPAAFTGEQRRARRGVASQSHISVAPARHMNLAHTVEVEVVSTIHGRAAWRWRTVCETYVSSSR